MQNTNKPGFDSYMKAAASLEKTVAELTSVQPGAELVADNEGRFYVVEDGTQGTVRRYLDRHAIAAAIRERTHELVQRAAALANMECAHSMAEARKIVEDRDGHHDEPVRELTPTQAEPEGKTSLEATMEDVRMTVRWNELRDIARQVAVAAQIGTNYRRRAALVKPALTELIRFGMELVADSEKLRD